MSPIHGGTALAAQLKAEGVDTIFTLTGGHISAIYDGCVGVGGIRIVDVRHEQAAAHAADAYARLNRGVGVAVVTAGPGLTDAITGAANAYYASSPLLLLSGSNPLSLEGMGTLQDAPHMELLRPVCKFSERAADPKRLLDRVRCAITTALAPRRGPAFLDVPMDVQLAGMPQEAWGISSEVRRSTHAAAPDPDAVKTVAEWLASATKPVLVCGSEVYTDGASEEIAELVRVADMPLAVNGMARGIVSSSTPQLVAQARSFALKNSDLIVVVGAEFDFRLGYGRNLPADVKVVQVSAAAERIGGNRKVDLGIVSNTRSFLRALLQHAGTFGVRERAFRARCGDEERAARLALRAALESDQTPIHPMRFVHEVARFVDEDAVLIGDGGDIVSRAANFLTPNRPGHWLDPGPFGCLGVGVPFAMAARLARPDKQVVALFGDGAFGFNGFEYDSAVRQNLPFVGVIGNDGAWGEMKNFHRSLFGERSLVAQDLSQKTSYEGVVSALGGYGERVERPEDIGPALRRAADSGVPSVVNVILDPHAAPRKSSMIEQAAQVLK